MDRLSDAVESFGLNSVLEELYPSCFANFVTLTFYTTRSRVILSILKERGKVLNLGTLGVLVNGRQDDPIELYLVVVLKKLAVLLVLPVETGEEEIYRDCIQTHEPTKGIVWHLVHWHKDTVDIAIAVSIMNLALS